MSKTHFYKLVESPEINISRIQVKNKENQTLPASWLKVTLRVNGVINPEKPDF
jgi:hypothetical protein